ncbi:DUF6090 family protein [Parvularcula marina]|uniref:Uncharacterized protein n=1 Tax=Parvularcula marina TaxID=2292771 RepID=A0A371RK62_9PROT|nr:DUF6090 family protein [Parvularcula marina]RFB05843.1 hypothetical protein DX908_11535 [Parvularcula marina]
MLLRRVMKHVRTHNWAAVFLDFIIVVAGILIAFQITNWNEARHDRRDERRYLAELAVNLEADLSQARAGQTLSLQRLATAEAILAEAAPELDRPTFFAPIDRDLPSNGAFDDYPYANLTAYFFMVSSNSTFEELIQTGRIGVISNRSLVKDLTGYYDRMDRQRGDDNILLNQAEGMLDWTRENGVGMADRASLSETVDLAKTDKSFLGFVKMASFLSYWQYDRLTGIEKDAETLLTAVQAEMEKR